MTKELVTVFRFESFKEVYVFNTKENVILNSIEVYEINLERALTKKCTFKIINQGNNMILIPNEKEKEYTVKYTIVTNGTMINTYKDDFPKPSNDPNLTIETDETDMTFIEIMKMKFPKADLKNLFIDCCPCNFGYKTEMTQSCDKYGCVDNCVRCWDSKIIKNHTC